MFAATLLTDASWCPDTGAAGYGYWIASDRGKVGGGAPFQEILKSSNIAEMQAICNVIYIAKKRDLIQIGDTILIQTDSVAAITGLCGWRNLNICESKTRDRFLNLIKDIMYVFRHVKGHSNTRDARSAANRYCDTIAKNTMREARQKIRELTNAC